MKRNPRKRPFRAAVELVLALMIGAASGEPVPIPCWNPKPFVPIQADGPTDLFATVRMDGTGSYTTEPHSPIVEYRWELLGGPHYLVGAQVDMLVDLTMHEDAISEEGLVLPFALTVIDDNMWSEQALFDVHFAYLASFPAEIVFEHPRSGITTSMGEGFSIDALGSSDPDGDCLVEVGWDLDNDGNDDLVRLRQDTNGDGVVNRYDADPSLELSMTWAEMAAYPVLQQPGSHPIRLSITDDTGVVAWDTLPLNVTEDAAVPSSVSMIFFGTGLVGIYGIVLRKRMEKQK